jgi:hypothetical protein
MMTRLDKEGARGWREERQHRMVYEVVRGKRERRGGSEKG